MTDERPTDERLSAADATRALATLPRLERRLFRSSVRQMAEAAASRPTSRVRRDGFVASVHAFVAMNLLLVGGAVLGLAATTKIWLDTLTHPSVGSGLLQAALWTLGLSTLVIAFRHGRASDALAKAHRSQPRPLEVGAPVANFQPTLMPFVRFSLAAFGMPFLLMGVNLETSKFGVARVTGVLPIIGGLAFVAVALIAGRHSSRTEAGQP
jgi:hypothetical protein